ncbi:MAG TPA: hypothetical protein VGD83_29470, partial [Streptosporangiaceae bacterium]
PAAAQRWERVLLYPGCGTIYAGVVRLAKDGRTWQIGTDAEVAWIANGTSIGRTITAAIPPVFDACATVLLPEGGEGQDQHDRAVLGLLREQSADQPWWLGYLDTGADDIVFPDAPRVTLYSGWHYVLVQAGPEQAATWRESGPWSFWKGALPNLMFPSGRSWLVSTLWDDDWTCVGGPAELVNRFLRHSDLQARAVAPGQDATPPGHQAL